MAPWWSDMPPTMICEGDFCLCFDSLLLRLRDPPCVNGYDRVALPVRDVRHSRSHPIYITEDFFLNSNFPKTIYQIVLPVLFFYKN
jgi:hypothetical protein